MSARLVSNLVMAAKAMSTLPKWSGPGPSLSTLRSSVLRHTVPTRSHLTPELTLQVMTPEVEAWHRRPEELRGRGGEGGRNIALSRDPYWAIYWPGGQALARYVLDHPDLFRGRRVLDLGSGCGACGVAAALAGAAAVTANDVDPAALAAAAVNAELNSVDVLLSSEDLLLGDPRAVDRVASDFDVVLAGDLLFDAEVGSAVSGLATGYVADGGVFLLGDPGRWFLAEAANRTKMDNVGVATLACVAKYELSESCKRDHFGFTAGFVYRVFPP